MTEDRAKELFERELKKTNLEDNYKLEFTNAKTQLGYCNYSKKTIGLSRWHLKGSSEEKVLDTILHELAHAIARALHGKDIEGHGREWKDACRQLGATPERLARNAYDVEQPPSKYTLTCPNCGNEYPKHRMTQKYKIGLRRYGCGDCNTPLIITENW